MVYFYFKYRIPSGLLALADMVLTIGTVTYLQMQLYSVAMIVTTSCALNPERCRKPNSTAKQNKTVQLHLNKTAQLHIHTLGNHELNSSIKYRDVLPTTTQPSTTTLPMPLPQVKVDFVRIRIRKKQKLENEVKVTKTMVLAIAVIMWTSFSVAIITVIVMMFAAFRLLLATYEGRDTFWAQNVANFWRLSTAIITTLFILNILCGPGRANRETVILSIVNVSFRACGLIIVTNFVEELEQSRNPRKIVSWYDFNAPPPPIPEPEPEPEAQEEEGENNKDGKTST